MNYLAPFARASLRHASAQSSFRVGLVARSLLACRPPTRHLSNNRPQHSSVPTTNTASANSPSVPRKAWRPAPHRNPDEPVYELYFTCKVCQHRSAHTISKQGYHKGTTLVKCPGCSNRHLISDHLKIFADRPTTVEDLLREKGEDIRKGSIDVEGDLEFWEEDATKGTAGEQKK